MLTWVAARLHSRAGRYAVTAVALLLGAVLTVTTARLHLPRQVDSYAFLLIIMGSAWWGGYGPGLVTILFTVLLFPYLTQPLYTIRHANLNTLPMVVLISVLISRMAGARATLRDANELLDERVRRRTAEIEIINQSLREREAQLMAQAESLSQSNADLEQFAYFASHDLQEPLRMIAIYTELLKQNNDSAENEDFDMCLGVVRDSVRRMEMLVQDLLTYSRAIHSDQIPMAEIDSRAALQIAKDNLSLQIEGTGATVSGGNLPKLVADQGQLIQIFQNLVGNALKYRSDTAPNVFISAERGKEEWTFSVKDNGIGIAVDYHNTIFMPFKRLHHSRQYSGSGVGLAICRRIVDRMNGRIWVESKLGVGSTFYFSVPTAGSATETQQPTSEGEAESRDTAPPSPL